MAVTPTYVPLATYTVPSGGAASITFSSIPATYRDLIVVVGGSQSAISGSVLEINADATDANYNRVYMLGTGSGTESQAAADRLIFNLGATQSNAIIQFQDYSVTDKHKTYLSRSNATSNYLYALAGRWANTNAMTSVKFAGAPQGYVEGTVFSLYGIH
jgi:hypothetical protein